MDGGGSRRQMAGGGPLTSRAGTALISLPGYRPAYRSPSIVREEACHESVARAAVPAPARRVGVQEQDAMAAGDDAAVPRRALPARRRGGDPGRPLRGD